MIVFFSCREWKETGINNNNSRTRCRGAGKATDGRKMSSFFKCLPFRWTKINSKCQISKKKAGSLVKSRSGVGILVSGGYFSRNRLFPRGVQVLFQGRDSRSWGGTPGILFLPLAELHQHLVAGQDIPGKFHLPVAKIAAFILQQHL